MVSIEKAVIEGETTNRPVYICVFRNAVGKNLFQGIFDHMQSKNRKIEEKALKHQLKIRINVMEGKTLSYKDCVISFTRNDDMIRYQEEFSKAVKDL